MSLYTARNNVLIKSGNRCAFPNCSNKLTDAFQVAHIRSSKSNGPRHVPDWNNNNFDVEENLICLCPTHHAIIDSQSENYSIEYLERIKREHEQRVEQFQQDSANPNNQFLKEVFDIIKRYHVVHCIRNGDYTIPTSPKYIENMEYCGMDLEYLIDESWATHVSRELLNDWSEFCQNIESFKYYLVPYLEPNLDGNVLINKNPNESREQIQKFRNNLMNILRKYMLKTL